MFRSRFALALALSLPLAACLALATPAQASSLNANVADCVQAKYQGTNALGPTPAFELSCVNQPGDTLGTGTGASQADTLFADKRTLAASATETLDLYGGLTDAFGGTVNFAKVKFLKIRAAKANTNSVIVGNAASNPFLAGLAGTTPTYTIPPGGVLLITAPVNGWAITNSSNDNLKIANSGGTTGVTYEIYIGGTSQ